MRILFFIFFYLSSSSLLAGRQMEICLMQCENKVPVSISKQTEQQLQMLFSRANIDAPEERQCIAKAIAIMEQDVYGRISRNIPGDDLNDKLYEKLTATDNTRNTRQFLLYLLDNQYIRQHVLWRKTKRNQWFGGTEYTNVIKSIAHYTAYAVDTASTEIAEEPLITEINVWRKAKTLAGIKYKFKKIIAKSANDKTEDELEYDFE